MGKHRLLVHPVQYEEGQLHPERSGNAFDPQAKTSEVAAVYSD